MTAESSTSMTRNGSCCAEFGVEELANAMLIDHQEQSGTKYNAEGCFSRRIETANQIRPTS